MKGGPSVGKHGPGHAAVLDHLEAARQFETRAVPAAVVIVDRRVHVVARWFIGQPTGQTVQQVIDHGGELTRGLRDMVGTGGQCLNHPKGGIGAAPQP